LSGPRRALIVFVVGLAGSLASCRSATRLPPPPPATSEQPARPAEPLSPEDESAADLVVRPAPAALVVAAWAEPARLPPGGGQAHVLVRVQKRGGAPYPDVEVRLKTTEGSLYSRRRVLVTDANGMTRDRLTTQRTAVITLNAGGTRYRFTVPVLPASADPSR
jgi:hypothetical protein